MGSTGPTGPTGPKGAQMSVRGLGSVLHIPSESVTVDLRSPIGGGDMCTMPETLTLAIRGSSISRSLIYVCSHFKFGHLFLLQFR